MIATEQGLSLPFNFLLAAFAADFILPRDDILCFDISSTRLAFKETLQPRNISKRYVDISTGYRFGVVWPAPGLDDTRLS
jgi:hypothetical protein